MHRVAARAHLRALHVLAVLGHHASRVGHRLLLGIAERSVEPAGRSEQEIAGERPRQPGESRVRPFLPCVDTRILRLRLCGGGRFLAEHHAVAGGAGNAIARQRRIMSERADLAVRLERYCIEIIAHERRAGAGVGVAVGSELALTLYRMAAEAGVLDRLRRFRMEGFGLAGELREEDRIASGEPLGRRAPGAVWRDVHHLVVRAGLGHVELQAGTAGAVAADALCGGHHLRSRVGLAGRGPHMVIGFRWHIDDGRTCRPRFAQQPEKAGEQRPVGRRRLRVRLPLCHLFVKTFEQRRRDEGLAEKHQRVAAFALDIA